MTYHALANDTGGTEQDRENERDRILKVLHDAFGDYGAPYTEREEAFLESIAEGPVSPKQLFWLRDIKDRYL